jgi:hypothetical protein
VVQSGRSVERLGDHRRVRTVRIETDGDDVHRRRIVRRDRQQDHARRTRACVAGDVEQRPHLHPRRGDGGTVTAQRPAQRAGPVGDVLDGEQPSEPGRTAVAQLDPRPGDDAPQAARTLGVVGDDVQRPLVAWLDPDQERLDVPGDPREVLRVLATGRGDQVDRLPLPGRDVDDGEGHARVGGAGERVGHVRRCPLRTGEVREPDASDVGLVDTGHGQPGRARRPPHAAQARHLLRRDELRPPPRDAGLLDESTQDRLWGVEQDDRHAVVVVDGDVASVGRDARVEHRDVERDRCAPARRRRR